MFKRKGEEETPLFVPPTQKHGCELLHARFSTYILSTFLHMCAFLSFPPSFSLFLSFHSSFSASFLFFLLIIILPVICYSYILPLFPLFSLLVPVFFHYYHHYNNDGKRNTVFSVFSFPPRFSFVFFFSLCKLEEP